MKKVKIKVDTHRIVSDAVEAGILRGLRRAFKHSEHTLPPGMGEVICEQVHLAVMGDLTEVVKWDPR